MTEAVAAAARELDRLVPGWAQKVEPDYLSLSSSSMCVLGQMSETGLFTDELSRLLELDAGFCVHEPAFGIGTQHPSRAALRVAWRVELEARRVEAPDFVPDGWSGDSGGAIPPGDRPALMGVSPSGG